MRYSSLELSHRYIILRDIPYRGTSHRYIILRDIPYRGTSYRYSILRDIPAKAWQKGYLTNILYQPEEWLIKNLIYRPIPRVGWEAYNPSQLISFRLLIIDIRYRA